MQEKDIEMQLADLEQKYQRLAGIDSRIIDLLNKNHEIAISTRVLAICLLALTSSIVGVDVTKLISNPSPPPQQNPAPALEVE